MVQTYIRSASNRGDVVMRSMAMAKEMMIRYPDIVVVLCDLVLFVQFKKREKHPWKSVF